MFTAREDRTCEKARQTSMKIECHILFHCERYNDNRGSWKPPVRAKCNNFLSLDVSDQVSFLFDNLFDPQPSILPEY